MIFLIQYNRKSGRIVLRHEYSDADRSTAQEDRLNLELELNEKEIDDEVVLLEAMNLEVLRRTHRRYFEDLQELASPSPPPPESELVHSR